MKQYLPFFVLFLFVFDEATGQNNAGGRTAGSPGPSVNIAASVQGFKKFEGYFTFYYDDKAGKVLLEVDKFDKDFLYFASLTDGVGNGGPERGQASSAMARFTRVGPKVFLVEPVTSYRAVTTNADEIKAVENAFAKSVIYGFVPLAVEGEKVLVDLTPFLIRDSQNLGASLGVSRAVGPGTARGVSAGGGAAYRVDETRSAIFLPNTKNFPFNTEFEAMLTFTGGSGNRGVAPDPSAVTVNMHQSFVELPGPGYKSRKFDPRSAFQQFSYMDFASPMSEPLVKRFIRRHRLEKKDPKATVSDPIKPIVYYVDRGAPAIIKKALIEGGAWWNEAFEAAGFRNAFQVKELPEGVDPMDIRYNVVNWVNRSGSPARAFSYGSSYTDPRTGEIIKGVVTLGADRHRQDYLIAEGLLQPYEDGKPAPKELEEYALSRIRQLSAHEIGHTLGFNHNFAASPKERASVMDYPFPRISLKADGTVDISKAYAKGIGSWDKRAVMWGYTEFPAGADESGLLDKIMQETLKQGFAYIPDIGGYTHPASHQWDDGSDPIEELGRLMTIRRRVLDVFSEKAIRQDTPMSTLEEVLVPMYLLHRYQIEAVAKSIGGLYFTHAVKNDGQVPTKMVDPAQEQRALNGLLATIEPAALALPDALIAKIPPRPSGYPGGVETFSGKTGPTFDPIAAAESAAAETISSLFDPDRAARLVEFSGRDERQMSFMGMADQVIAKTWKAELSPGYRGDLQVMVNNLVLKNLLQLAANTRASENVRGEALLKISELQAFMTSALGAAKPKQKANILFGLSQIAAFSQDPDKFQPAPATEMPPGAPIGMPGMEFIHVEIDL